MKAQEYENRGNWRVKFASMDRYGFLVRDATEEYAAFFLETPGDWSVVDTASVETLRDDGRQTWLLRSRSQEMLAVEHETGIEFLLSVGSSVTSTAVVELISWAWRRWRNSRAHEIETGGKAEPTLVLEAVENRFPDGRIRRSRKLEFHGPIDQEAVSAAMKQWKAA